MELCLIREGLARHCTEAETAFAVQGLGSFPLLQSGRPETRRRLGPAARFGRGGRRLRADRAGLGQRRRGARARRPRPDGDGYRLTGEKIYISNAPEADVYSVFARTTEGAGARGLTAFWVPRDSPGLTGERDRARSRPHPIGRLVFEDVHVPAEHVLGEVDRGFRVAMRTLDLFRPSVGAFAVGMAQAAIDAARDHADRRATRSASR